MQRGKQIPSHAAVDTGLRVTSFQDIIELKYVQRSQIKKPPPIKHTHRHTQNLTQRPLLTENISVNR